MGVCLIIRVIQSAQASGVEHHDDMVCFMFRGDATAVTVRMATSLISAEQALVNLDREVRFVRKSR